VEVMFTRLRLETTSLSVKIEKQRAGNLISRWF